MDANEQTCRALIKAWAGLPPFDQDKIKAAARSLGEKAGKKPFVAEAEFDALLSDLRDTPDDPELASGRQTVAAVVSATRRKLSHDGQIAFDRQLRLLDAFRT